MLDLTAVAALDFIHQERRPPPAICRHCIFQDSGADSTFAWIAVRCESFKKQFSLIRPIKNYLSGWHFQVKRTSEVGAFSKIMPSMGLKRNHCFIAPAGFRLDLVPSERRHLAYEREKQKATGALPLVYSLALSSLDISRHAFHLLSHPPSPLFSSAADPRQPSWTVRNFWIAHKQTWRTRSAVAHK